MSTVFTTNSKKFKTFLGGLLIYYIILQKSILFETFLQKFDNYCICTIIVKIYIIIFKILTMIYHYYLITYCNFFHNANVRTRQVALSPVHCKNL